MKGSLRPANRAIGQRKVVLRDTDAIATSLKLDDAMKSRVQRLATTRDHSAHLLMREKARESFKAEANASWAAYKETGRHITGEETADWLNSWGADAEIGPPARHD